MSIFFNGRRILESADNLLSRNLLLGTNTPDVINGDGKIGNVGNHIFPLVNEACNWKKGQIFTFSCEVYATKAEGTIYFGFNAPDNWNSQNWAYIKKGTNRYSFIGQKLAKDNTKDTAIQITVDNSTAEITIVKPMLVAGAVDVQYTPALATQDDLLNIQNQINQLKGK